MFVLSFFSKFALVKKVSIPIDISNMKYEVFVSYFSKDQRFVEEVCSCLEGKGYCCFVAYKDIPLRKNRLQLLQMPLMIAK